MSSSFVLGSTIATCRFIWFHTISYGVKVWTFRWPHVPPVDVIVPHKVFGHLRPMFWSVNIWKLHLDVWQKVILELVRNSFSMMSSNMVSLDAPLLLMAPQTWTLSGCFGFPKTIGAESVSVMVGLILMGLDGAFIGEYNLIEGIVITDEFLAEL